MAGTTVVSPQPGDEITSAWGTDVASHLNGMQVGSQSVPYGATGSPVNSTLTFPRPYVSPPIVLVSTSSGAVILGCSSVTATGFTVAASRPTNAGTGNITASWIAIGVLA